MGTSSADPRRLDAYLRASAGMAEQTRARLSALATEYDAVVPRWQWGSFDASATLGDLATWARLNDADDRWLAAVSAAFTAADAHGLGSVEDAALDRALNDAGVATTARQDLTVDDPVMAAAPATSGFANDPVCTATGHLVEVEQDLAMPWRAGPLAWVRTYTSRWLRTGPFGRGWASWASCSLAPADEGDGLELVFPDGKRAVYRPSGGGFQRVGGVPADLVALADGHQLRYANGDTWAFDDAGLLSSVSTSQDRVAFERDGLGRVARLVHDHGRCLQLGWSHVGAGHERVTTLTSSDGRVVTYCYDDDGDLVSAVRPGGVARTYVQGGGGLITSSVDADGVAEFVNTYDVQGWVLTQVSPFGRTTRFRHVAPGVTVVDDTGGGPSTTYLHDRCGRLVGVVDDHDAQLGRTFDEWGNLAGVTDRTGATTTQLCDRDGRLLSESDAAGSTWSWRYDGLGRVVETVDPLGAVVRLSYTGRDRQPTTVTDALGAVTECSVVDGEIVWVTDPDGVTTLLERDSDGLVTVVVDGLGGRTVLHRDATGAVTAVIDAVGGRTAVELDDAGRVARRLLPTGGSVALEWTPAGRLVAATNPVGGRSQLTYGPHGEVIGLVDAAGVEVGTEWDALGRVARVTRPDGQQVEHTYDGLSRLVSFTDPSGGTWTREHDAEGRITGLLDPAGRRQDRRYDALGRLVQVDDGAGVVTRYDHDVLGRVVALTDGTGAVSRAGYDAGGRQVTATDPEGGVTQWSWSPAGRLLSVTSPAGRTARLEYDPAGRPMVVIGPHGDRGEVRRDAAGRVVAQIDGDGEVALQLDAAGRVVGVTGVTGAATRFERDATGRSVAVTDPTGATTRAGFDRAGRLVSMTDPLGDTVAHAYDQVGLLAASTGPDGSRTTYSHDGMGRVETWTDPLGSTTRIERDPSGRETAVVDATGRLTFDRDPAGRVVGWTDRAGVPTELSLDPAGRVLRAGSQGRSVALSHDGNGRLRTADHGGGRRLSHTYDADGQRLSLTHPDGTVTRYERDAAGRVTAIRPPASGVTRILRHASPPAGLSRDAAGRVVAVTGSEGVTRYGYDAAGQLTSVVAPGGVTRTWAYRHGRRVTSTAPDGDSTYRYDATGRLTSLTGPGGTTRLRYDAAGRRVGEQGPGGSVDYGWDGLGRLVAVTRTAPDATATTTTLTLGPLGDLDAVGDVELTWDRCTGVSTLVQVGDQQIDPVDVPAPLSGDPFAPGSAPYGPDVEVTRDGDVVHDGLLHLRARTYDPATGLFLSGDPWPGSHGDPTAGNPWAYAGNDPVGMVDPTGLTPMTDADLAAYQAQASSGLASRVWGGVEHLAHDPVEWASDHVDGIVDATLIGVGGALLATGILAPIGAGILIGAAASMATQVAVTGEIDARQVWVSAVAGGASAGMGWMVGAATTNAGIAGLRAVGIEAAAGAGADATTSAVLQYKTTGHVDPARLAIDTTVGAVGGGVGGYLRARGTGVGDARGATGQLADSIGRSDQPIAVGLIPESAWQVLERVDTKGATFHGYRGGSVYRNKPREGAQLLPTNTTQNRPLSYTEWDVNPPVKGEGRGLERIVISSDGRAYYTRDHYVTFIQFR